MPTINAIILSRRVSHVSFPRRYGGTENVFPFLHSFLSRTSAMLLIVIAAAFLLTTSGCYFLFADVRIIMAFCGATRVNAAVCFSRVTGAIRACVSRKGDAFERPFFQKSSWFQRRTRETLVHS